MVMYSYLEIIAHDTVLISVKVSRSRAYEKTQGKSVAISGQEEAQWTSEETTLEKVDSSSKF